LNEYKEFPFIKNEKMTVLSGNKIIFVLGVGSSVGMAIFALMMFLRN